MDPMTPHGSIRSSEREILHSHILELVQAGTALTRRDITRELGVAPSTVSLHVGELVNAGILEEYADGESTGGRKPRLLRFAGESGHAFVADLGGTHIRMGLVNLAGALRSVTEIPHDLRTGPEETLTVLEAAFRKLSLGTDAPSPLRGMCVGVPGPVNRANGAVDSPSRMPGWNAFPIRSWLEERFGVTTLVENDANLMALGEHFAADSGVRHSVTVKAGTAIGSGIIVANELYHGATGAAGDITHARVSAAGDRPCSCGNRGCLETIASGAAILRDLRAAGVAATSTADIVGLARDADPTATTLVRTAGKHLGEVLTTVVNFFNPSAVFLGGALSAVEPFVASVRSQLYEGCHPLVTQSLRISPLTTGQDAGLVGAGRLILSATRLDLQRPSTLSGD